MVNITEYFSDLPEVIDMRDEPLRALLSGIEEIENLDTQDLAVVTEILREVPALHEMIRTYSRVSEEVRWGNRRVQNVLGSLRINSFKSIIGANTYV